MHYSAAAYLGTRPTFDDGAPVLEVFLFEFDGDLYGHEIEVEFIDFIRPDRRFDNAQALQAQMDKERASARKPRPGASSAIDCPGQGVRDAARPRARSSASPATQPPIAPDSVPLVH